MMGLKGKLGTALLSASMLGMLIGTPVQAASSVSGKLMVQFAPVVCLMCMHHQEAQKMEYRQKQYSEMAEH